MRALRVVSALAVLLAVCGCFRWSFKLDEGKKGDGDQGDRPAQLPSRRGQDAGGGGDWKDIARDVAGRIFLEAEHGAVFYAFDTLAYPNEPVDLTAKLISARDLKPIPNVTVGIYRGQWLAGHARSNARGYARVRWVPPKAGNYTFTARIVSVPAGRYAELLEVSAAPMLVAARTKETPFVVIDLDHTVVDSSFFRVLLDGGTPMADSVAVTKRIAKAYSIIYLTHRPDVLTRKTKLWLRRHGYPPGPLLVSDMEDIFDSGRFKTAKLAALQKAFPATAIGIGDKHSDAQAYVDHGLVAYLIPHYKRKPKDMRKAAQKIARLRGRGRLHVVSDWRQIEAGIFGKRSFPASAFCRSLSRQATEIEARQRQRKDRGDDDD